MKLQPDGSLSIQIGRLSLLLKPDSFRVIVGMCEEIFHVRLIRPGTSGLFLGETTDIVFDGAQGLVFSFDDPELIHP